MDENKARSIVSKGIAVIAMPLILLILTFLPFLIGEGIAKVFNKELPNPGAQWGLGFTGLFTAAVLVFLTWGMSQAISDKLKPKN